MESFNQSIQIKLSIENKETTHSVNLIFERGLTIVESLLNLNILDKAALPEIKQVAIYGNDTLPGSHSIWESIMVWVLQRQVGLNRNKPPFHSNKLRALEPIGIYFDSIFKLSQAFVNYAPDLNINVEVEGGDHFELAKAICLELSIGFLGSFSYQEHISSNTIALFKPFTSKVEIATNMLAEINELNKGRNPYSSRLNNFYALIEGCLFIKRCRYSLKLEKKEIDQAWENYKDAYLYIAKKLPKDSRLAVFWEDGNKIYESKGGRCTKLVYDPQAISLKIHRGKKNAKSPRTI